MKEYAEKVAQSQGITKPTDGTPKKVKFEVDLAVPISEGVLFRTYEVLIRLYIGGGGPT